MSRQFHIQRIGDPKWLANQILNNSNLIDDIFLKRYSNYALIYEDYRTAIELNKTIEDLLTHKYVFGKFNSNISTKPKKIDFETAKLELETYNTLIIQSLFTTAIVTYAKWFTKSSGGDKTTLEASKVFKKCSTPIQKTHAQVMDLRHLYFAHSGPTLNEITFPLHLKSQHTGQEWLTFFTDKKRLPTLTEVRRFNRLFLKAIEFVDNKLKELEPKTLEAIKTKTTFKTQ